VKDFKPNIEGVKILQYKQEASFMRKIILLTMLLIFAIILPCYADSKEIIAEGTYIASENDSPLQGEEAALLIAKRAALEQAGTYVQSETLVSNLQLKDDQVKSLTSEVIVTTVLDKSRTFNGKNMVFWVKIKAIVYPDKLLEVIKSGFKLMDKPVMGQSVMGVVTIVDLAPGAKFDAKRVGKQKYDFNQFVQAFHIADPFNQAVTNKYSSRSLITETKDELAEYIKDKQLGNDTFATASGKYKYEYVLVNILKFNKIESVTGTAFFTLEMKMYWQTDATMDSYLYDAKNGKLIFNDVFKAKKESRYGAGVWLNMPAADAAEKALDSNLRDLSQSLIDQTLKKLPSL
jgi:hypothetical protein